MEMNYSYLSHRQAHLKNNTTTHSTAWTFCRSVVFGFLVNSLFLILILQPSNSETPQEGDGDVPKGSAFSRQGGTLSSAMIVLPPQHCVKWVTGGSLSSAPSQQLTEGGTWASVCFQPLCSNPLSLMPVNICFVYNLLNISECDWQFAALIIRKVILPRHYFR